jgi:branched-chain amino acid transport system ATP-binding protein
MTVRENLEMGAFSRRDRAGIQQDLERVFALFPRLRERLGQAADSLSGGEQQMLAIGRGLMAAPRLLLLDEPTLGLAPVVVDQLIEALRTMTARFGVSLLIAEQSIQLTQELCSTVHVLVDGRITRSIVPSEFDSDTLMSAYLGQG